MPRLIAIAAMLSACATTALPGFTTSVRSPALSYQAYVPPAVEFPALVSDDAVPNADRLRAALREAGREKLTMKLEVCVHPTGSGKEPHVVESSGVPDLDRALALDIFDWRFAPYRAPPSVSRCEILTIVYKP